MPIHSESIRVFRQNHRQREREIIQKANVAANKICSILRAPDIELGFEVVVAG
jgi:hypothetical protein